MLSTTEDEASRGTSSSCNRVVVGLLDSTRELLRDTLLELSDCVKELREETCDKIDNSSAEDAAYDDDRYEKLAFEEGGMAGCSSSERSEGNKVDDEEYENGRSRRHWEMRSDMIAAVERYSNFERVSLSILGIL